jgi:hypothetical protein
LRYITLARNIGACWNIKHIKEGTMSDIKRAISRLTMKSIEAISEYTQEMARGGAPAFPDWAEDLVDLIDAYKAATQTATTVRDMLREDFKMADNRDAAVAEAVRAWYVRQYPHLGVLPDQPDLASIIGSIRAVHEVRFLMPDIRLSKEEREMMVEFTKTMRGEK